MTLNRKTEWLIVCLFRFPRVLFLLTLAWVPWEKSFHQNRCIFTFFITILKPITSAIDLHVPDFTIIIAVYPCFDLHCLHAVLLYVDVATSMRSWPPVAAVLVCIVDTGKLSPISCVDLAGAPVIYRLVWLPYQLSPHFFISSSSLYQCSSLFVC